jgi:phospholipid/cholesterol/gamma-HCH transport system permease protein
MLKPSSFISLRDTDGRWILVAKGRWVVNTAAALNVALQAIHRTDDRPLILDLSVLQGLDTAGAWAIHQLIKRLQAEGTSVELVGIKDNQALLLEVVAVADRPGVVEPEPRNAVLYKIEQIGENAGLFLDETKGLVNFIGLTAATFWRLLLQPRRMRWASFFYHLEKVGLNALPIVGLISFLVGVVMAYQGAGQLQRFGADIFVVDLVGISVLREIGILLTAIMVAGRSGSAFTAQIGAMKVNEEIDAMKTLGLDPIEVLVLPRVMALVVAMPLLGFFADITGVMGGALMAWVDLDIMPSLFIERLNSVLKPWTLGVGLLKAPFFAILIGMTGCYEGMRVEGSAESVGLLTTRSVVESIFLVIVADALFSIFFRLVGI